MFAKSSHSVFSENLNLVRNLPFRPILSIYIASATEQLEKSDAFNLIGNVICLPIRMEEFGIILVVSAAKDKQSVSHRR